MNVGLPLRLTGILTKSARANVFSLSLSLSLFLSLSLIQYCPDTWRTALESALDAPLCSAELLCAAASAVLRDWHLLYEWAKLDGRRFGPALPALRPLLLAFALAADEPRFVAHYLYDDPLLIGAFGARARDVCVCVCVCVSHFFRDGRPLIPCATAPIRRFPTTASGTRAVGVCILAAAVPSRVAGSASGSFATAAFAGSLGGGHRAGRTLRGCGTALAREWRCDIGKRCVIV